MHIVIYYAAYLGMGLAVIFIVARTLRRNGRRLLLEAFHGDCMIADSITRLLMVGFYLVGISCFAMVPHYQTGATPNQVLSTAQSSLAFVLFYVGMVYFINLFAISQFLKRGRNELRTANSVDARIES